MIGGDKRGRRGIVLAYALLACLGFPFKWSKTKEGLNVQWVGYETAYASFRLGISERRASWLSEWTGKVAKEGKDTWADFAFGLGRLGFGANALSWERPFLGPLYGWSAATRGRRGALQVPVMLRTILHWLSQRFRTGDRLQAPPILPVARDEPGLCFYSDAKAETGNAWVGGYLWDGHSALQWYALEVLESWAPWAFIKRDLKRTIASLELLGTLICIKLWGKRMKEAGKGQGHLTGGTDNQGNSYAVSKLMSTRFPLPLLLMELSETLRQGDLTLDYDLTNQEFGKFSMERRLAIDGAQIDWIVLGDLLGSASTFHAELTQAKESKRKGNPEHSAKGRKKARQMVIPTRLRRCMGD